MVVGFGIMYIILFRYPIKKVIFSIFIYFLIEK